MDAHEIGRLIGGAVALGILLFLVYIGLQSGPDAAGPQ